MIRPLVLLSALVAAGGMLAVAPFVAVAAAAPAASTPVSARAAAPGSAEVIDGVAAVVGGDIVLLSEVEQQTYVAASQAQISPSDTTKLKQIRQDTLDRLIDEKLILQEATRQGLVVPDSEITTQAQTALQNVKSRFKTDAEYKSELRAEGTSEDDLLARYRKDVGKQLLAQRLIGREVTGKVDITDQDVVAYFAKNKDKLPPKPATARVSQLVLIPTVNQVAEDAGRDKALALLAKIRAGADFGAVAKASSADSASAVRGGDLGWFGHGEMDNAFEAAAFNLAPGKMGGPVRSRFGYHLILVVERDQDRVHARHILIRVRPSKADLLKTRVQAEALRKRIIAGEGFAAIASAYSTDPNSKDRGGDLGDVPVAQMPAALRQITDALPLGGVSQVMQDDDMFYLFTVSGRTPETAYTFDEVKGELKDVVRQEKLGGVYDIWVKGLRAKTHVDVKPRAMSTG